MRSDRRNRIVTAVCFGIALLLIVAMTIVSESDGFVGIGRKLFFLTALVASVAAEVSGCIVLDKILVTRRNRGKASEEFKAD